MCQKPPAANSLSHSILKNQFWHWMSTSKKWSLILAHNAVRAWPWIRSQKQPNVTAISVAKTVIVGHLNWRVRCIHFPGAKSFILLAMLLPQVTLSSGWVIIMSDTRQPGKINTTSNYYHSIMFQSLTSKIANLFLWDAPKDCSCLPPCQSWGCHKNIVME